MCLTFRSEEHVGSVLDGVFSNVAERSEELLLNSQFDTKVFRFVAKYDR